MKRVQIIEHEGKPAYAVVPIDLWQRVREGIEDADAEAAYDRAVAKDDGFIIPAAVPRAELDGSHPVRAWREHRGLTMQALANGAGVSPCDRGREACSRVARDLVAKRAAS